MKTKSHRSFAALCSVLFAIFCAFVVLAQGITGLVAPRDEIRKNKDYENRFVSGVTDSLDDIPLVRLMWFSDPDTNSNNSVVLYVPHYCFVYKRGFVIANEPGFTGYPDATNLQAIAENVRTLPLPSQGAIPVENQLVVGGIRSNKWFSGIYDRANLPDEVKKIYAIDGISLERITNVQGKLVRPIK